MHPINFAWSDRITAEFEHWVRAALREARTLAEYTFASPRSSVLRMALTFMKAALSCANALGCPDRKALCLRVLNWLRADLRRLSNA